MKGESESLVNVSLPIKVILKPIFRSVSYCVVIVRWLPRVCTKVSTRTGKGYKRNPNSVVLQSLFLRFASKVTNIITLIFQFLLLRHRSLSWQQNV